MAYAALTARSDLDDILRSIDPIFDDHTAVLRDLPMGELCVHSLVLHKRGEANGKSWTINHKGAVPCHEVIEPLIHNVRKDLRHTPTEDGLGDFLELLL